MPPICPRYLYAILEVGFYIYLWCFLKITAVFCYLSLIYLPKSDLISYLHGFISGDVDEEPLWDVNQTEWQEFPIMVLGI